MTNQLLSDRRLLQLALVVTLLLTVACGSAADASGEQEGSGGSGDTASDEQSVEAAGNEDQSRTVGFSFLHSEVPAAGFLKDFAQERADELGVELLTDNITGGAVDEQLRTIDSFFTRQVDALVIHASEPSSYAGAVRRAKDAGVPYVSYGIDVPDADAAILFPFDEAAVDTSAAAAEYVNENLGGDGKVLLLTFTEGDLATAASEELGRTIEEETDAEVVAQQDAVDQATGLRITEDTLQVHPDLDIVMAWNDGGALGAAQAFRNAGKDPAQTFIASNEGGEQGLQALKSNPFVKLVSVLSIRDIGYAIVDTPMSILQGEEPADALIGRHLIGKDDETEIDQLLAEYE